jgi:hypothetical protein
MRENLQLNGRQALVTGRTRATGRDSDMAFWFVIFSPVIGVMGGLLLAWFFSSLIW